MQFDPFKQQEVTPNETHEAPKGRLQVLCSQPVAVFIEAQGYEVLAAVGQKADITLVEPVRYRIEARKGTRCFVTSPRAIFYKSDGEIFTNSDRQPLESGALMEVRKAVRQHKLEMASVLQQTRDEARKFLRDKRKAGKADDTKSGKDDNPEVQPDLEAEKKPDEQTPARKEKRDADEAQKQK